MEPFFTSLDNSTIYVISMATFFVFSLISLGLFLMKIFQIIRKRAPSHLDAVEVTEADDIGVIVAGNNIEYKGKKLKYFILKNNSYESEKLAIGSKVKILKKTSSEAYVKPI